MIEELLEGVEESIASIAKKYYGVATARVINPLDPLLLGRVQVQLPFVDALDLQPWARVASPMAGILHGHYFVPNIGDEVLVAFEHGDLKAPYIIGSLWTALAPPPLPSPVPQIRGIRTLVGNQLVFTEAPPTVTLQTGPTPPEAMPFPPSPVGPHHTVALSPAGIQAMSPTTITLAVGTSTLVITPGSITLECGGNVVALTPGGIEIAAAGPLTIAAAGPCSVTAPLITLN
ncbi:hypothetical protein tb265_49010 [Gemmatimonadetes bacterium T265]|nr:hypothetical protein tb265_49010 [Gemmatimonadetes bacterium T265]